MMKTVNDDLIKTENKTNKQITSFWWKNNREPHSQLLLFVVFYFVFGILLSSCFRLFNLKLIQTATKHIKKMKFYLVQSGIIMSLASIKSTNYGVDAKFMYV